jgi:hypothetical protein
LEVCSTPTSPLYEFLADYATFCSIWNEISPDEPMFLQSVRSPGVGYNSKTVVPAFNRPTLAVGAKNFDEQRPLLIEIRAHILKGDGTGRGTLPFSGYHVQPAAFKFSAIDKQQERQSGSIPNEPFNGASRSAPNFLRAALEVDQHGG